MPIDCTGAPSAHSKKSWVLPCLLVLQSLLMMHVLTTSSGQLDNANYTAVSFVERNNAMNQKHSNASLHSEYIHKLMMPPRTVPNQGVGIPNILLSTRTDPPFHMFVFPLEVDKYVSRRIVQEGLYEKGTTKLISDILPMQNNKNNAENHDNIRSSRSNDVDNNAPPLNNETSASSCKINLVLDMGSNLGYYSLLAASRGYQVVSFEASPDTAWLQRSSASLNGWLAKTSFTAATESVSSSTSGSIILFDKGVSDVPSTGRLSRHDGSPGMTSFATADRKNEGDTHNNKNALVDKLKPGEDGSALDIDIQLIRADDILWKMGLSYNGNNDVCFKLLKIDVEGYELKALRGLDLDMHPFENIVMEYFPTMLKGAGMDDPLELLRYISLGERYEFYIIGNKGDLSKVELGDDRLNIDGDHINLLAKRLH